MTKLNKNYAYIDEKFGRPTGGPSIDIASLKDRVPGPLFDFWDKVGFGVLLDGLFQVCHPGSYQPVVDMIFEGDPDFDPDRTLVIGISAFGDLAIWNEDHRDMYVSLYDHTVRAPTFLRPTPDIDPATTASIIYMMADGIAQDEPDDEGNGMFDRALSAHGPLNYGTVYAPRIHPLAGGPRVISNLEIKNAVAAISETANLAPFVLVDYLAQPPETIRKIGR